MVAELRESPEPAAGAPKLRVVTIMKHATETQFGVVFHRSDRSFDKTFFTAPPVRSCQPRANPLHSHRRTPCRRLSSNIVRVRRSADPVGRSVAPSLLSCIYPPSASLASSIGSVQTFLWSVSLPSVPCRLSPFLASHRHSSQGSQTRLACLA